MRAAGAVAVPTLVVGRPNSTGTIVDKLVAQSHGSFGCNAYLNAARNNTACGKAASGNALQPHQFRKSAAKAQQRQRELPPPAAPSSMRAAHTHT